MKLFLVQHGLALPSSEDALRPLSDEGVEAVTKISRWAKQMNLSLASIRHSGKLRAEQTAHIFAEQLDLSTEVNAMSGLGPNDDVTVTEKFLTSETESLMLVGHLPFLNRLTSLLVSGNAENEVVNFHKAGIVCLQRVEQKGMNPLWTIDWIMLAEHIV